MQIQSVNDLAVRVARDPQLEEAIRLNPASAIANVAATPLQNDRLIYRIVVISLGLTVIISIVGALIMSYHGKPIPEGVIALGSAAVGALAGLLASPPQ